MAQPMNIENENEQEDNNMGLVWNQQALAAANPAPQLQLPNIQVQPGPINAPGEPNQGPPNAEAADPENEVAPQNGGRKSGRMSRRKHRRRTTKRKSRHRRAQSYRRSPR